MTAALDTIRARHVPMYPDAPADAEENHCEADDFTWPCDAAQLLAALDRAEAVVAAARVVEEHWTSADDDPAGFCALPGCGFFELRDALRAYEDADKVADG